MSTGLVLGLRSAASVVAGYATIVVGTVLTLTVLLGDVSYFDARQWEHAVGAVGTIASGLLGGFLAAKVAGRRPLAHAAAVVAILIVEITWIVTQGIGPNPAWFDLAGGLTLMATTVLGAWIYRTRWSTKAGDRAAIPAP